MPSFLRQCGSITKYTLVEPLEEVAIIGVLVAISIPIFTSQLEKSRDAVSVANIRAAYAEATSAYLTKTGDVTTGSVQIAGDVVTVKDVVFKGEVVDNFSGLGAELPVSNANSLPTEPASGKHDVTFTFTANSNNAPAIGW